MQNSILNTKIFIPSLQLNIVNRKRLIEKLNNCYKYKITLVSAPAGFGKTTLVAEWISESKVNVSWLSLDQGDNDFTRFITYFIAALRSNKKYFGNTVQNILHSPQLTDYETILTSLINEITSSLNDTILVLDDYHLIESLPVHKSLNFLLDHLPPNLHLILCCRHDPPIPLARLRVRNQICEIREADLRFTVEEAIEFFNKMNLKLTNDDVASLESRTEGWIASLQLAGLAIQGRKDISNFIADFTGTHNFIVDYLTEEVLQHQPEDIHEFLLKTSILDRFNSSLCNAVTGLKNSKEYLEKLSQSHLFLIPLDEQKEWYRYHHLFGDLLIFKLKQNHPHIFNELHIKASKWYEEHNFTEEAMKHALAAGDSIRAAELIESVAVSKLINGELTTLERWISAIPQDIVAKYVYMNLCMAWIYNISNEINKVEPLLKKIEKALLKKNYQEEEIADVKGHIALLRSYYFSAYYTKDPSNIKKHQNLVIEAKKNLKTNNPTLMSTVNLVLGSSYTCNGEWDNAIEAYKNANYLGELSGNNLVAMVAVFNHAQILIYEGKLREAYLLCNSTLKKISEKYGRFFPPLGFVYLPLGILSYEFNQLKQAEEYFILTMQLGEKMANKSLLSLAPYNLACLYLNSGRIKEAKNIVDQFDNSNIKNLPYFNEMLFESTKSRYWIKQKNLKNARDWLKRFLRDPMVNIHWYLFGKLVAARYYIAAEEFDNAINLLDEIHRTSDAQGSFGWMIEALILKSIVYNAEGESNMALSSIIHALSMAEPEGYIRKFVDEGKAMKDILVLLLTVYPHDNSYTNSYISELLEELPEKENFQPLDEPLSDRELEVLRLLASGYSNKDIADKLFVALGTIKKHTHTIYQKMNVDSRIKAIQLARDLNLI